MICGTQKKKKIEVKSVNEEPKSVSFDFVVERKSVLAPSKKKIVAGQEILLTEKFKKKTQRTYKFSNDKVAKFHEQARVIAALKEKINNIADNKGDDPLKTLQRHLSKIEFI